MLKNKEFIRAQRESTIQVNVNDNQESEPNEAVEDECEENSKSAQSSPNSEPHPQIKGSVISDEDRVSIPIDDVGHPSPCSWCFQNLPPQFFLPPSSANDRISIFCSESCFSQYRRAVFKQTKVCNWCKKATLIPVESKSIRNESQHFFCSTKCQNLHTQKLIKMPSKHQRRHQELLLSPSQILLAQAWLQSQIQKQNQTRTSQILPQDRPSLKVKPDHQLLAPPNVPRVMKSRRMALRDQPTRRFRDMQGIERRKRHKDQKHVEQENMMHKRGPQHQGFPPQPGNTTALLPPPTLMLPYPVFLPIPLPLFLPVPAKLSSKTEPKTAQRKYKDMDLCGDEEAKVNIDSQVQINNTNDNEDPLVVDVKKEGDEIVEETIVQTGNEKVIPDYCSPPSNIVGKNNETKEDELRRKRRALIMDR